PLEFGQRVGFAHRLFLLLCSSSAGPGAPVGPVPQMTTSMPTGSCTLLAAVLPVDRSSLLPLGDEDPRKACRHHREQQERKAGDHECLWSLPTHQKCQHPVVHVA